MAFIHVSTYNPSTKKFDDRKIDTSRIDFIKPNSNGSARIVMKKLGFSQDYPTFFDTRESFDDVKKWKEEADKQ